jgi:E3 ubiquitin-protein ligase RGLG
MLAVDFTKSNSWTGKASFGGRCLHDTSAGAPNPYERVVSVLGRTVEHMLGRGSDLAAAPLLCWGFGDASTGDTAVFSFLDGNRPAQGFTHALERYRQLAPAVVLAGPTSFGPAIRAATAATLERGNPFTVLVLIADGQVTRSADTPAGELSPQEADTIDALVAASALAPLAVIMVGVGDGPWEMMQQFDDLIPARSFGTLTAGMFSAAITDPALSQTTGSL